MINHLLALLKFNLFNLIKLNSTNYLKDWFEDNLSSTLGKVKWAESGVNSFYILKLLVQIRESKFE